MDYWTAKISECQKRQLQWSNTPSDQEIATVRADYADHLALLDDQLGLLLEHLAEPERTAITIVSDHGELLGDGGFFYKSCFLEGAVRSMAMHHRPSAWNRARSWQKPVGLSWFLSKAAEDVRGSHRLSRNQSPNFVLSEFGEELLVTDRYRKLAMNYSGELLWAVDLKRDPEEQTNLIEHKAGLPKSWHPLIDSGPKHLNSI